MVPRFLGLALLAAATAFAANDCDRACLKTTLNQYLDAVIKHDPAAAPLFVGFRQTENAVVVKNGTGLWKTMTALGKMQRRYLDAVSGQAAYFGTIEEGAETVIVSARIKVDQKKIMEAEWYIARKSDPGLNGFGPDGRPSGNVWDSEYLAKNPPVERVLSKDQRMSREAMAAVVNSYFDGIDTHDGAVIIAQQGCTRIENGNPMAGNLPPASNGAKGKGGGGDCTSNLQNINVQMVAARRYPVIDEEAGVVLANAIFIRKPGTATRRNVFAEYFVLENNKIKNIYSAMFYPTSEVPVPNWPPYDGNWPLSPTLAPAPASKQ